MYSDDDLAALYDVLNPWAPCDDFHRSYVMAAGAVLDVVCGTGAILHRARERGHTGRLCGIDPDLPSLRRARTRRDVEWVEGGAADIAWLAGGGVVAALPGGDADGVDRREVQHIEAHAGDVRQPALHVREGAVAARLVPAFFDGTDEVVSSFGLFEATGVALLVRLGTIPADGGTRVAIGVRAHGDPDVGERLRERILAWDRTGRPGLARLRIRAIPIERPYQPGAGETVLTRPCTQLVLDWPA